MTIDILLGLMFVSSGIILWSRIARKLPEVAMIPHTVITEELATSRRRFHIVILHILHFRTLYQGRHYQDRFWQVIAKMVYRVHILLLRMDNSLVNVLRRVRAVSEAESKVETGENYWKGLKVREDISRELGKAMNDVIPPSSVSIKRIRRPRMTRISHISEVREQRSGEIENT